jgi:DNA-binding response OmpR family regulator
MPLSTSGALPQDEPVCGQLLIEAPRAPELARLALSVIREDPGFAFVGALAAVAATEVHRVRPDWGFDDFIIHPYRPEELHWRLEALKKQRSRPNETPCTFSNLRVDLGAHEVTLEGRKVPLTHKEFSLLKCLLQSGGNVLSRQQLVNQVWGDDYGGGRRTVDTHVRRLRSKLGPAFPLLTVRGAGYRLSR